MPDDPPPSRTDPVALFVTCVGEAVDPDVPVAVVRVLRAAGCEVDVPDGQTCCGQPAWNSGFTAEAARVAATSLDALAAALDDEPDAVVVIPAGSCATMMRLYWPQLFELAGDPARAATARRLAPRLREFTEFLSGRDLPPTALDRPLRAVYHRSCHLQRELHVVDEPVEAVGRVQGCDRAEWDGDDQCCGFGGTFSVKLPETSVAMADEKLDTLPSGTQVILGADTSCLLQLRGRAEARRLPVRTMHVAQLLEQALDEADGQP